MLSFRNVPNAHFLVKYFSSENVKLCSAVKLIAIAISEVKFADFACGRASPQKATSLARKGKLSCKNTASSYWYFFLNSDGVSPVYFLKVVEKWRTPVKPKAEDTAPTDIPVVPRRFFAILILRRIIYL